MPKKPGYRKLCGQAVGVLVFVTVRTVDEAFAHAGVAAVEQRHQFGVLHVRYVGLVARLAGQGLVAGQPRRRHAHARDAHAAHAAGGYDDGVHLVADIHDPGCLVTETLGEPGEYVASLHDMGIRRNGFHRPSLAVSSRVDSTHVTGGACPVRGWFAGFR